jgi:hypothetical protein
MFFFANHKAKQQLRAAFFARFDQKVLLIHQGFPAGWLEELLKQPGGAGYFRVDLRLLPRKPLTPLSWFVHDWALPQGLPQPFLAQLAADGVRLRHLQRDAQVVHPSEILWFLDEMGSRFHVLLRPEVSGFRVETGMALQENFAENMFG